MAARRDALISWNRRMHSLRNCSSSIRVRSDSCSRSNWSILKVCSRKPCSILMRYRLFQFSKVIRHSGWGISPTTRILFYLNPAKVGKISGEETIWICNCSWENFCFLRFSLSGSRSPLDWTRYLLSHIGRLSFTEARGHLHSQSLTKIPFKKECPKIFWAFPTTIKQTGYCV